MPGGFGTLDECFETLTLIQTGKIKNFPVVIMGKEYFSHMRTLLEHMIQEQTIDPNDLSLILFTDSPEEAAAHIEKHSVAKFKLVRKVRLMPRRWLGE
jgi:predicted Rossmann-fold nucleotide-binding protein